MINSGKSEELLRELLDLYRQKQGLLAEMSRVTTQMSSLSEAEETDIILELLQERQGYMDSIDTIDAEIRKHSRAYDKMPDIIEEHRLQCQELVGGIQEMDRQQRQKLVRHFNVVEMSLERVKTSRQTINAYHKRPSKPISVFIDKKE